MDTLRGSWGGYSDADDVDRDPFDPAEDEIGHEAPPPLLGQDERRMQVRAYNHWASLLGSRHLPLIDDLATGQLPDFDPFAVLIDLSDGIEDPLVRYLGSALAAESGCDPAALTRLSDVPSRSLASRITDHYLQIIANEAPIGFEAEFVNQRGQTMLYRGILLPFAANPDDDRVTLVYGVINWKELADQQTTDELLLAIDHALRADSVRADPAHGAAPLQAWADGPEDGLAGDEPLELTVLAEPAGDEGLAGLLANARELAQAAQGCEDRTRHALYAAIGLAHDFALAALAQPDDYAALVTEAGLTMQARAPLIPVVKLVFGADYDKTRLTEYATVIAHAQRLGLGAGALTPFLVAAPGGLKGLLNAERERRRIESGKPARGHSPREALARQLRGLPTRPLGALSNEGDEFTLVIARRTPTGVVLVGEVANDIALIERAAKQLLG